MKLNQLMKKLKINGRELQYQVILHETSLMSWRTTEFYEGIETISRKKYLFFGKTIIEVKPKKIFEIEFNIENPKWSKDDIKKSIDKELAILEREAEIERGEII